MVYWLLLFVAVISGLAAIFKGRIVMGLPTLLVGVISARIWCELLMCCSR